MKAYAPTRKTLKTLYTNIPLKFLIPSDIDAENFDFIFNLALTLLSDKIYEPMDSFLSNSNAHKIMQQRMAEDPEKLLYFLSKAIEAQKHKYINLFDVLVNLGLIKHINDKITTVNRANFQSALFDFASIAAIRGFPEALELFLTTPGPFFGIEGIHTISPLKLATLASKDFTLSPIIRNACSEVLQAQKRSDLLKVDLRLFMSIMASDLAMLKQTLAKSPNLEAILNQSIEGLTPLYLAVLTNKVHIAEMLLEANADVNAQCDGHSLLHTAVRENNPSMVRLLLEKKANINAMDLNGETPLKICLNNIQNGVGRNAKCETLTRSKQILKILLAHKPDLSLCNARRELQFLRNSVFHPMVNSAVVEMNQDFKKFSTSVKGLPFPYEIIGKIMSFVVEYKSETELTNDATHILSKWHVDRSSSPGGIKKRNSREEEAGLPKRWKV